MVSPKKTALLPPSLHRTLSPALVPSVLDARGRRRNREWSLLLFSISLTTSLTCGCWLGRSLATPSPTKHHTTPLLHTGTVASFVRLCRPPRPALADLRSSSPSFSPFLSLLQQAAIQPDRPPLSAPINPAGVHPFADSNTPDKQHPLTALSPPLRVAPSRQKMPIFWSKALQHSVCAHAPTEDASHTVHLAGFGWFIQLRCSSRPFNLRVFCRFKSWDSRGLQRHSLLVHTTTCLP